MDSLKVLDPEGPIREADLIDLGAVQFEQAMKNQYEEDELENAHSNKSSESR